MDRMATKTLAEIYRKQGHFQKAYEIFKALAEKDPLNREIQERLKELREKLVPPHYSQPLQSTEEKVRYLEKWLVNIRKRRRG
jgi:hypothetical protein